MKFLFYLAHPAHYHLFKNIIYNLKQNGHKTIILIQKKDILENLVSKAGYQYKNILEKGRKGNMLSMASSFLKKDIGIVQSCIKFRPNLLISSAPEITHAGKLLNIPSILIFEDDLNQVKIYEKIGVPYATHLLVPNSCNVGKWNYKTSSYSGCHELTYLAPKYFNADKELVASIIDVTKPYFLIRFSKLDAYHDTGKTGITGKLAWSIINLLKDHGNIFITSEKDLDPEFSKYQLKFDPSCMHHVLNFSSIYIGDSQTMTAEAAVLGIPSVRFNDFVGKLGYLEELEHKYQLTHGFKTSQPNKLLQKLTQLLKTDNLQSIYQARKLKMLSVTIDVTAFIIWFLENYPESVKIMKEDPDYQYRFK